MLGRVHGSVTVKVDSAAGILQQIFTLHPLDGIFLSEIFRFVFLYSYIYNECEGSAVHSLR